MHLLFIISALSLLPSCQSIPTKERTADLASTPNPVLVLRNSANSKRCSCGDDDCGGIFCTQGGRGQPPMCGMGFVMENYTTTTFSDWDNELSAVVKGPTSVSITPNIMISNAYTIDGDGGHGYTPQTYQPYLESNLNVKTDATLAVYNDGNPCTVPDGSYGVIVLNPWTQRFNGRAYYGVDQDCCALDYCVNTYGPWYDVGFDIDSRESDPSHLPAIVVGGAITCLTSTNPDIPYLVGSGTHNYTGS